MTKEQAIEWLKSLNYCDGEETQEVAQAIDIAIQALEQPTCEDCVSRKELLKLYGNRAFELQKTHQTDKQLGINWCINTLNELPPVTPKISTSDDCVSRTVLIEYLVTNLTWYDNDHEESDIRKVITELINDIPPVTPTHGTCKDCKHRPQGLCCNRLDKFTNDSFYCADFEKRGNENESIN